MHSLMCSATVLRSDEGSVPVSEDDRKYRLALDTMLPVYVTARLKRQRGPKGPRSNSPAVRANYLIFDSLNSTCLRATGSYFFLTSLSVMVREFFLAT